VTLESAALAFSPGRARVVALLEVVLCSSLPTQLLLSGVLAAAGLSARTEGGQLSVAFVVTLSLGDSLLLVALMVALSRLHGQSVWQLWRGTRPVGREAVLGLTLAPLILVGVGLLLGAIQHYLPALHNVPTNPLGELASGGPGDAALLGLVAVVAGGLREELQRAFLLRRFELHLGGTWVGVVVLSAAFGLGHLLQGWDAVIATSALGAGWAVLYVWRRSSVAPIVSHAGFNAIEVLQMATLSG
jgi:membrane protease YdiL (CAAX protease family)